jgi:hypothetical protein
MNVIRESAHLYNNPTDEMGYGIPNFEDALLALQNLGIEDEFRNNQFVIYPNPALNEVNISFPTSETKAIALLYDIFGKLISETEISTLKQTINLAGLAQGMYLLKIHSENRTNSFKVLKK